VFQVAGFWRLRMLRPCPGRSAFSIPARCIT
jgi:hypothetical protein